MQNHFKPCYLIKKLLKYKITANILKNGEGRLRTVKALKDGESA